MRFLSTVCHSTHPDPRPRLRTGTRGVSEISHRTRDEQTDLRRRREMPASESSWRSRPGRGCRACMAPDHQSNRRPMRHCSRALWRPIDSRARPNPTANREMLTKPPPLGTAKNGTMCVPSSRAPPWSRLPHAAIVPPPLRAAKASRLTCCPPTYPGRASARRGAASKAATKRSRGTWTIVRDPRRAA